MDELNLSNTVFPTFSKSGSGGGNVSSFLPLPTQLIHSPSPSLHPLHPFISFHQSCPLYITHYSLAD